MNDNEPEATQLYNNTADTNTRNKQFRENNPNQFAILKNSRQLNHRNLYIHYTNKRKLSAKDVSSAIIIIIIIVSFFYEIRYRTTSSRERESPIHYGYKKLGTHARCSPEHLCMGIPRIK